MNKALLYLTGYFKDSEEDLGEEEPQNHRCWPEPLEIIQSKPPARVWSQGAQSRLPKTMSGWIWIISKDGDSTTSLGSMFQCLKSSSVFNMFR